MSAKRDNILKVGVQYSFQAAIANQKQILIHHQHLIKDQFIMKRISIGQGSQLLYCIDNLLFRYRQNN